MNQKISSIFSSILKWRSPIGYLFSWTFQSVMGFYLIVYGGVIMCIYLGFSLMLLSILKDITNDLSQLKGPVVSAGDNYRKLTEQFRNIASNYADVKRLIFQFPTTLLFLATCFYFQVDKRF